MPMLEWAGKKKVVNHHNAVPYRVLERKWGYGDEAHAELRRGGETDSISGVASASIPSRLRASASPREENGGAEMSHAELRRGGETDSISGVASASIPSRLRASASPREENGGAEMSHAELRRGGEGDEDENMIIHGDNLLALKSLLPRYEGRVKCVYIDPPYNTGNEGWVYNDNVNDPQIRAWLNKVVGKEGEDFTRHDKWLCMMYPRLMLLRKLLAEDGAIFISIDDNELYSLKAVCDEIFGSSCFVANISWQRTYSTRNDSKGIVSEVEHILAYSKKPGWQPNKLPRTAEMDKKYKNPDNDVAPWKSTDALAPDSVAHQGMVYAIQNPFTGKLIYPTAGRHWAVDQQTILDSLQGWCPYELRDIGDEARRAEICGVGMDEVRKGVKAIMLKNIHGCAEMSHTEARRHGEEGVQDLRASASPRENVGVGDAAHAELRRGGDGDMGGEVFSASFAESRRMAMAVLEKGPWPKYYFMNKGKGGIAKKTYISDVGGMPPTNLWEYRDVGHTDEAKKELMVLFGGKSPFDTPKPVRLIERILKIATDKNALVLDSFAGSGTTAHAVLNMNKADGGNRRFILIEMMDYAESVTAERVKRVISGYGHAGAGKSSHAELRRGGEGGEGAGTRGLSTPDLSSLRASAPPREEAVRSEASPREKTVEGTGGGFGYYELGPELMRDGVLNEAAGEAAIREYVWYTETKGAGEFSHAETRRGGEGGRQALRASASSRDPYLLGTAFGVAYYFCYERGAVVTLNRALLRTVKTKAERYVIYADVCTLGAAELEKYRITFKKIPRDITRF